MFICKCSYVDELKTIPESDPKTGNSRMPRFCINGAAMRFEEDAE